MLDAEDGLSKARFLFAAIVLCLAPVALAQHAPVPKERFRLRFEVSKNGAVVAQRLFRIESGRASTIVLTSGTTFTLTPSRIDANTVRVDCESKVEAVTPRVRRVFQHSRFNLQGRHPGFSSFSFGGDSYEIRATVER